ncbi:MAG: CsgG/HfaB family protein [Treponema sp.]|nr:CsgG/HfaB family protein [Treponema sp.]
MKTKLFSNIITMTIISALAVMLAASCGSSPQAAGTAAAADPADEVKPLRTAIQEAAALVEERLPEGTKLALLNFNSPSDQFSEYVLEELSAIFVNSGRLIIVDRNEIDLIRSETDFQWSGEVSDTSAQEIGQMLGAQSILSGSLSVSGDFNRFMVKALNVQTARVEAQYPADIAADSRVKAMLASGKAPSTGSAASRQTVGSPSTQAATPAASSQGTRQQPAPIVVERTPTPAQAPALKSGTYTFYPRPRATKAGVEMDAYIDRIVIRSGYFTVYLVNKAMGKGGGPGSGNWVNSRTSTILQDLDRPARTWSPINSGDDSVNGGVFLTFQGVTATRFSITHGYYDPPVVFDEIILGEPDS